MYIVLLRLIIVILGIYLFFKYLFCIVLEMLADDPNNTDEINEEVNYPDLRLTPKRSELVKLKLTSLSFQKTTLFVLAHLWMIPKSVATVEAL